MKVSGRRAQDGPRNCAQRVGRETSTGAKNAALLAGGRSHETSTTTPLRHEIGSGHLDSNFNDCTAINIQRWSGYGSLGSTSHLKIALMHVLALDRLLWAMLGAHWWEKWTLFDCVIWALFFFVDATMMNE